MTYKRLRFRCLSGTILGLTLLLAAQPRDIFDGWQNDEWQY
jgi:hypothetical protein